MRDDNYDENRMSDENMMLSAENRRKYHQNRDKTEVENSHQQDLTPKYSSHGQRFRSK